ncbi:MAG: zinc ribbon domain-containing protein [Chloroflexi bacterium]|nr:zinc ribbon domain-containing protein [Chloroflexota bacterium]
MFCSHCGTENPMGGYSCTRCGERLVEISTDTPSPQGLVACATCGGTNNTRAVYCWVCGTEMNDAVRISPAPQERPKRTPTRYQPDLNPISVPTSEPTDERADLRGPAPGSPSGAGPGARASRGSTEDNATASEKISPNTSGTRSGAVPSEIKGWNWAAFLVTPVWGIFSGVPFAALLFGVAFLPIQFRLLVVVSASLFLGFRGNELAWRGKKWRSVKHFNSVQRIWATWAIVLSLVAIVLFFLLLLSQGEV